MMRNLRALSGVVAIVAMAAMVAATAPDARAERADRGKPIEIEANRMTADEKNRTTLFEGGVVLVKGTIEVRAERVLLREEADGSRHATANGSPVKFRQRLDAKDNQPAAWVDGEAQRVEIDERGERIELFEKARITRDRDEIRGNYIFIDLGTELYTVSSGKDGAGSGRVRAVIAPRAETPAGAAGKPAAESTTSGRQ